MTEDEKQRLSATLGMYGDAATHVSSALLWTYVARNCDCFLPQPMHFIDALFRRLDCRAFGSQ